MNLRDQAIAVLRQHGASYHFMNVDEAADAILALVRAHLTSEEAIAGPEIEALLDALTTERKNASETRRRRLNNLDIFPEQEELT